MTEEFLPKGIKEAVERILKAADKKEKIIIFGDTDLDGIASVVILKELFELLNLSYIKEKKVKVYFPDREQEGHGLSIRALKTFKDDAPAILFVVDCGVNNFQEVEEAKKMGLEVIIIDHHSIIGKVPKASILINPKKKGDPYPFKEFAAAGLVYKLAEAVLAKTGHPDFVAEGFLEIAALATLSDMMPQEEDNQEIIEKGLESLQRTQRPGILALADLQDADLQEEIDIYQKIIAPLNSAKLKDNIAESYILLTESPPQKAKILGRRLVKQNREKKRLVKIAVQDMKEKLNSQEQDCLIIFEASDMWIVPLLGVIASKLLREYKKPVFLLKIGEKESTCSARLPQKINGVDALTYCKKYLEAYGGHPPACGCRLKNENIGKFKNCLEEFFKK
jgi:single-stranded-DNA-specific exonuclease